MVPIPLGCDTFLYWINLSEGKSRRLLKKEENVKGWYCENNFNLQKQLYIAVTIYAKCYIVDVW